MMKNFLMTLIAFLSITVAKSQSKVPTINVKDIDGKTVNTNSFNNGGKPYIIVFAATWNSESKKELNTIKQEYGEWQQENGAKVIVVMTDESRALPKVKPFVESQSWDFEVYTDENGDFQRAMSIGSILPSIFIVTAKNFITAQFKGYKTTDEIYKEYKKAMEKK